ncbi:ribosomal protein S18-alanine N-acetyltransferase [Carnobacteriaceae bacterium zg-84]|uniref:ribosomal protein S18-alanine N-acetyltransferase n=1 Tax=Granulicatella sp. zg-84 TaxID=2678503 RepID=UPI0013C15A10|nr:ribosomal protein S18-alanine N-acetyltransferase [Granulicatella sp. zg-84]NEW66198.1 ribosomal-protein-alanine N-acetyltransferase [Granulicatella sp. zg-84]QMI86046.1 ribosomal protein S18-alanine N-acetyltransferase [Carnobacteriaceae bacterium zg-84]
MIRQANIEDALFLYQIAQETGLSWSQKDFEDDLQLNRTIYFVSKEGFIGCQYILNEAEITNIAVSTKYQGKGHAKALWQMMHSFFSEKHIDTCFLEVRESNESARRFYEKIGFRLMSTRKKYYKNPVEHAMIYRWKKDE